MIAMALSISQYTALLPYNHSSLNSVTSSGLIQSSLSNSALSSTLSSLYANDFSGSITDYASAYSQTTSDFLQKYNSSFNDLKTSSNTLSHLSNSDDSSKTLEGVKTFIEDYNNSLSFTAHYADSNSRIHLTQKVLLNVGASNKSALADLGISISQTGKLSLDEKKFMNALTNESTRTLSTLNYIGDRVNQTSSISLNASKYALIKDQMQTPSTSTNMQATQDAYDEALARIGGNRQFMMKYNMSMAALNMFINYSI